MNKRPGRRRQRPTPDTTVPSPCNGVCTLDSDNICVGCLRDQDQIRDWMIMDRDEKLSALSQVAERRSAQ